jgi:hypothetical protein
VEAIWRELDPLEEEIEDNENLPYEKLFPALRKMGAFALMLPEEFGGYGLTVAQFVPLLQEFAKVQGGIRVVVHVHNTMVHAFSQLASAEQKAAILPGTADGTHSLAFGLTEPDHGTGADMGTTITRAGKELVVNGRKWLITNSDIASHFVIYGRSQTAADGFSAVIIERDTPGLTIEALPETMGCKGGQHGLLTFTDVRVPASNLLGGQDSAGGLDTMERTLEVGRVFIAASSLGICERAVELSLAHAKNRVTFGKPIAARQAIQRYLAEMGTDVYALRTMLTDVAAKLDRGIRAPGEASMCKLFGSEAVARVTDRALLVYGGIGYTRKHPVERLYRDARLNWFEEGTPTVQYMVTAGALLEGVNFDR